MTARSAGTWRLSWKVFVEGTKSQLRIIGYWLVLIAVAFLLWLTKPIWILEKRRLPSILASLQGSSVLAVADMDHFVGSGGMIQFVMQDFRVRLAIDVSATSRARLKVSSKLLSLALAVRGSEGAVKN